MLALLCGGQGLLSADMFNHVADRPEAATIFGEAARLLGEDPRRLVQSATSDLLTTNRTSQILSVTAALTLHACIQDALPEQLAVTGYSVGEMAAWSIAGIWTAATALRLTDERARAMDVAGGVGGRLGYVRGLRRPAIERLTECHHCVIAITNPGDLFVIGGHEPDVIAVCAAALAAGAVRADLLAVKIASHTSHLATAVAPLRAALAAETSAGPVTGRLLLAGGDGERVVEAATAAAKLAAQVATPIDWATTLEVLSELGVDRALDLGPGHALAEMARAELPKVQCYAADAFHTIAGIRNWLTSG
ncbi:malonyl CoA-ACP transacylase [Phyllobacterium bourgognense]|uniref:[acyl-carrier-protein] S-malonyltransferase n=1 Tax=Phyllobacterium bourgognense TaxID=314236 RepID=A0A368YIE8_9HYPH|nr:malonyl CoA-ACP transacylase [Phyllobacterium bourgognense]RCW77944.1 [acyl-carrier-protein] S-malonyltransferase [Phyllobacterium bourgognense]